MAPEVPEIWNNLGASFGRAGKADKAITAFRQVCALRPDHAAAAMNLGRLLLTEGQAEEAERWLMQANQTRPKHGETLRLLAEARIAMGQPRTAIPAAEIAVKFDPDNLGAHLVLGHAYLAVRQLGAAKEKLNHVLDAVPDHPEATYYLAEAEEKSGNIEEARRLYDTVLDMNVDSSFHALLRLRRALAIPVIAESQNAIETDRQRITRALADLPRESVDDPYSSGGFTNFYLAYHGENDRQLQEQIARYYLDICPGLARTAAHIQSPPRRDRYRVAVLSSFLRNHTVGYLCRGLIEHLDRKRFEVVLLRSPIIPLGDPISPQIAAAADQVVDLPDSLPAARDVVAETEADLLYYPEIGMEDLVYFLAFARSTPVQVMGWGHPVTSGIPNMDAFLSVGDMEPESAEEHYSERLIKLNGLSLCVSAPEVDENEPDKSRFGMDPSHPAYLCAQSLFKIHPDFDSTIDAILKGDPAGRLYFITMDEDANKIFLARLKRRIGNDIDRVKLLPRVRSKDFPSLLKAADVLLDVPHWSGGKTSLEGLAVGTPIVHWPGALCVAFTHSPFTKK